MNKDTELILRGVKNLLELAPHMVEMDEDNIPSDRDIQENISLVDEIAKRLEEVE